jgi:hypothetical protein
VKAFSAITYLDKDTSKIPPMFIVRAGHDEVPTMLDSIDRPNLDESPAGCSQFRQPERRRKITTDYPGSD